MTGDSARVFRRSKPDPAGGRSAACLRWSRPLSRAGPLDSDRESASNAGPGSRTSASARWVVSTDWGSPDGIDGAPSSRSFPLASTRRERWTIPRGRTSGDASVPGGRPRVSGECRTRSDARRLPASVRELSSGPTSTAGPGVDSNGVLLSVRRETGAGGGKTSCRTAASEPAGSARVRRRSGPDPPSGRSAACFRGSRPLSRARTLGSGCGSGSSAGPGSRASAPARRVVSADSVSPDATDGAPSSRSLPLASTRRER